MLCIIKYIVIGAACFYASFAIIGLSIVGYAIAKHRLKRWISR